MIGLFQDRSKLICWATFVKAQKAFVEEGAKENMKLGTKEQN